MTPPLTAFPAPPPDTEVCAPKLTVTLTLVSMSLVQLGLLLGGVWLYRHRRLAWHRRHRLLLTPPSDTDTDSLYSRPYEPYELPTEASERLRQAPGWRYEDTGGSSCGAGMGRDCCEEGGGREGGKRRRGRGGGRYNGDWMSAAR